MRRSPVVLAALAAGLFGLAPPGQAAAATTDVCGDSAPAKLLLAGQDTAAQRPSGSTVAAVAAHKARTDTATKERAEDLAAGTMQAHEAAKRAAATTPGTAVTSLSSDAALRACAEGKPLPPAAEYTSGPGYAWVNSLNQQGQVTSYYCGPATVSEMAWTVPGPSGVDQWTAGSYMGTDGNGTNVGAFVNGLNNYVGVPDFGWNFYGFVWMDYNPTAQQRADFLSRLQYDVSVNSPIAGDAWEVAGGPHLVGHPAGQTIFHYFEIGGWNTNTSQVYYADSATTVWSSVPRYSWMDTYTVATILGGRGYAW